MNNLTEYQKFAIEQYEYLCEQFGAQKDPNQPGDTLIEKLSAVSEFFGRLDRAATKMNAAFSNYSDANFKDICDIVVSEFPECENEMNSKFK